MQAIVIVKYLNEDGRPCTNWHLDGEPTREDAAGLLEMVKFDVLREYLADVIAQELGEEDD